MVTRRNFLALPIVGTALLGAEAQAAWSAPELQFLVSPDYVPALEVTDQEHLLKAGMDFVQENYSGHLPLWGKFLSEVDLEKRLRYGIHSLCEEIRTQRAPLDPAWLVAMVFAESFFNEFAISPALAVGVSQFIAPTGRGYGLRCGETLGPLLAPDAGQEKRYWELNGQRRALPIVQHFTLEQALQGLIESTTKQEKKKAQEQLAYLQQREGLRQEMQGAGSRFMNYLRANMQGRDIFNSGDRYFLVQLDDRLTPHTALPAMVRLMAENLRQCKGNILVATAAYNAGLQSTQDEGPYECYGRIPANRETTLYVSRILVNYSLMKEKM